MIVSSCQSLLHDPKFPILGTLTMNISLHNIRTHDFKIPNERECPGLAFGVHINQNH